MDKHKLEWPPAAFASCGLWTGDGRIIVIGRDGKIGTIRRGSSVKLWETLPAPAVAISVLTSEGAAVAVMDGTLVGFSKRVCLKKGCNIMLNFILDFFLIYKFFTGNKIVDYQYSRYNIRFS